MSFVHLHTHTEYSMLDSTIRVADLVARAADDGAPAIAMTDHNNMFGAVEFFKAAKKAGVKPILGSEVNIVPEARGDAEVRRSGTIVLLCRDMTGYKNLCYMLSRAWMDSPARAPQPRIDRELLAERAEGVIALSGSLSGEIPQAILRGDMGEAQALARRYRSLFGEDGFYLEIVRSGIKEQDRVNQGLLHLSEEMGLPLVAGADAHYGQQESAAAHEVLMCVQLGKMLPSLDTKARITDQLHLAPAEEMAERFSDLPEAVRNTAAIAERCDVELDLGNIYLPQFDVPEGFDSETYLAHLAEQGLLERFEEARAQGLEPDEAVYRKRLEYELGIIDQMGFPGYFLIVWDFINYGKQNGVPVGPGRGSGAGSLVAYSLRITDIDPIRYSLLFERFLNPERVSMPDFDIDFCMHKRDRVIRYVTQKYGEDNVGQIITYGKMKAKAVVRDVARVLGLTFGEADRAAKLIPDDLGMTLQKAFKAEPRLQELCGEDPRYDKLFEVARLLEGLNRQTGMHAAGVVIGEKPLWEYVPLYAVHDEDDIVRITQFAKDEVEEAGLVKFDFLGLKTLTVIDHAVRIINDIKAARGEDPLDVAAIPIDDKEVFDLITHGDTTGVFQLESSGFKELLRKLKPDCFEDIIAAVALYRPGPLQSGMVDSFIKRKHGEEPVEYPHPKLKDTLGETYGVMVYQEQIMQAASVLAGFSLGQADILRRAMGKKKIEEMKRQRVVFRDGCVERGVSAEQADLIFDTIDKFAGYGFNKSHSAAYGFISYQTAWLKTHHPVEFMAALLTCDGDNTDKVVRLIAEARTMGITVLPPSVNASDHDFTAAQGAIRFGLGAIKGVGGGAVESILQARRDDGPFESLFDFTERVDLKRVNRRVMEALVKCGAFDDFELPRKGLFDALDKAIERGQQMQRDRQMGQFNLFGELEPARPEGATGGGEVAFIDVEDEWSDKLRLAFEKQCLGFYVSGHPLDRYQAEVQRRGYTPISDVATRNNRDRVDIAAVVTEMRERPLKSGNGRMAFVTLEDHTGQVEMLVFSRVYAEAEEALKSDEPLRVSASVQHEGEGESRSVKLRAESVRTMADVRMESTRRIRLRVDADRAEPRRLQRLQEVLLTQSEGLPVEIVLALPEQGEATIALGQHFRLTAEDEVIDRVERVIGRDRVAFL